jgi:hypothetical protein
LRGGTFINKAKNIQDMLKKFNMDSGVKGAKTPMPTKVTLKEICPRGNNNIVIIIFLVYDNVYTPC